MISVDRVYQTVQKILNKEQRGYLPPNEFNLFATQAQIEIFENYFFELGRSVAAYGYRDSMYENIPENIFEKLEPFVKSFPVALNSGTGTLPTDMYRLETLLAGNIPVEHKMHDEIGILERSELTRGTTQSPYYTRVGNSIRVYPNTITIAVAHYIGELTSSPKWTYMNVMGKPVFNPGDGEFQDFELQVSVGRSPPWASAATGAINSRAASETIGTTET